MIPSAVDAAPSALLLDAQQQFPRGLQHVVISFTSAPLAGTEADCLYSLPVGDSAGEAANGPSAAMTAQTNRRGWSPGGCKLKWKHRQENDPGCSLANSPLVQWPLTQIHRDATINRAMSARQPSTCLAHD
jgi:hypothetical protein